MDGPLTVEVRGAGGAVWTMDIPPEGTNARDRFDEQVVNGDIAFVNGDPRLQAEQEAPVAPPLKGAGSGLAAWAAYAELLGVEVSDEMTKAEIIAAVDALDQD